jgi:hypothetical protein
MDAPVQKEKESSFPSPFHAMQALNGVDHAHPIGKGDLPYLVY